MVLSGVLAAANRIEWPPLARLPAASNYSARKHVLDGCWRCFVRPHTHTQTVGVDEPNGRASDASNNIANCDGSDREHKHQNSRRAEFAAAESPASLINGLSFSRRNLVSSLLGRPIYMQLTLQPLVACRRLCTRPPRSRQQQQQQQLNSAANERIQLTRQAKVALPSSWQW